MRAVLSLTTGPNLYLEAHAKAVSSFAEIAKRPEEAREQISRSHPSCLTALPASELRKVYAD
jgi:hypothetical protein